jgi:hypothetical protein
MIQPRRKNWQSKRVAKKCSCVYVGFQEELKVGKVKAVRISCFENMAGERWYPINLEFTVPISENKSL